MKFSLNKINKNILERISTLYFAPIMYMIIIFIAEIFRRYDSTISLLILVFFTLGFYVTFIMIAFGSIAEASARKRSNTGAVMKICGSIVATLIFFTILYMYIYLIDESSFQGNIGDTYVSQFISFLYFSFITFATIGFGDIYPASLISRAIVILEVVYQFIIIVLVISQFTIFRKEFKENSPFDDDDMDESNN